MDEKAMTARQRTERWHDLLAEWGIIHRNIARGHGHKTMIEREMVLREKLRDFENLAQKHLKG